MVECSFCLSVSADGMTPAEYQVEGAGEKNYRTLCQYCAEELESLGMDVEAL